MPPDGRQEVGGQIEALAFSLDAAVTNYLNMLSLTDRRHGEAKVRDTIAKYKVLTKTLKGLHK